MYDRVEVAVLQTERFITPETFVDGRFNDGRLFKPKLALFYPSSDQDEAQLRQVTV